MHSNPEGEAGDNSTSFVNEFKLSDFKLIGVRNTGRGSREVNILAVLADGGRRLRRGHVHGFISVLFLPRMEIMEISLFQKRDPQRVSTGQSHVRSEQQRTAQVRSLRVHHDTR